MKVLVPIDGSENAARAVEQVIHLIQEGAKMEVHLLNVQPALRGDVASFLPSGSVRDYHQEEGLKALAGARELLDRAKVPYQHHICVGPAAQTIADYASQLGCEQILMGSRGLGAAAGFLLGSVATGVVKLAEIPVTLVK